MATNIKWQHAVTAALIAAAGTMSSCIDDAYDLSDIDKTVQVQVKDLVLPINLDAITLDNVLDLDDESVIKDVNGEYAIVKTGTISSEDVKIDIVTVHPSSIKTSRTEIFKYDGEDVALPDIEIGTRVDSYEITDATSDFEFHKDDVDPAIKRLDQLTVDWSISVTVSVEDPHDTFTKLAFKDLVVKLPKGLTTPGYDNRDGLVTVADFELTPGVKTHTISIPVTAIDLKKMDAGQFTFTPGRDKEPGVLDFKGVAGVYSGYLITTSAATIANVPQSVWLNNKPVLSDMVIKRFTGMIDYILDDFKAPSITLDDLPDVLNGPETNIVLTNPQLYVALNNPMAAYSVSADTGLTLKPVRDGKTDGEYSLNPGQLINIGFNKGVDGPYYICMSPEKPDNYYPGYEGAEHVGYSSLSNVLSGAGLPQQIDVTFDNPGIHNAEVRDFELGVSLGKAEGNYTVYAPLALDTNSRVVYVDTVDGWADDTLDKLTITKLNVTATMTNDMPFDLVIDGYPIDVDGRQCRDAEGNPVKFEGVTVKGNTTADIDMYTTGAVTKLDGIHFTARATVVSESSLKPATNLKLNNLRVKVSGHYDDEL